MDLILLPLVFLVGALVGAFIVWLTLKPALVESNQPTEKLSPGVGGTPR